MKRAIVIHADDRGEAHSNIARILDFFGVPWTAMHVRELLSGPEALNDAALIGTIDAVRTVLRPRQSSGDGDWPTTAFAFATLSQTDTERALRSLCPDSSLSLAECGSREHGISISPDVRDFTGPMSGIEFAAAIEERTCVITACPGCTTIAAIDGAPVFIRMASGDATIFFSACPSITNIDDPVSGSFFDVKSHFLAAVPFVMFVKHTFREVVWREQELGACLIVDDPLLKFRYGRCDFRVLKSSMEKHGFTTNISFIPWNWRRTSQSAAQFFREDGRFSVSIHGCDHTKGEFGDSSVASLESKARLAMARMTLHEARTGIHHDRVMVFPQGVFSSVCPQVLKRTGYIAAVNTETVPVDIRGGGTQIRDVWDVAIMKYGDFPVFTRRYAHHGIENFAFDLLLGKPCLIVSHHGFFDDQCTRVTALLGNLHSLPCKLTWRSLEEVIRRSCRRRTNAEGVEEVQMYGNELAISNPLDIEREVKICKLEDERIEISDVRCNAIPVRWTNQPGRIAFKGTIPARGEKLFAVEYQRPPGCEEVRRPMKVEFKIATRRILSELRDMVTSS